MTDDRNIIFLDIDGVLNNRTHNNLLFECPPENYDIDTQNLKYLKHILDITNTMVIPSTSWRNYPDDYSFINKKGWEYKSLLPKLRTYLSNYILTYAPHVSGRNKYGDIKEIIDFFISKNPQFINKFAILDDDPMQGLEQFNDETLYKNVHWFKTTKQYGLNEEISNRIINYFNNDPNWNGINYKIYY